MTIVIPRFATISLSFLFQLDDEVTPLCSSVFSIDLYFL
jgi:hypothetical protein